MFQYLIFVSKILQTPNNICFINNIIFKSAIKSIFLILDCFLLKPRLESKYNFWQYKNNIVCVFVNLVSNVKVFSYSIWGKYNNY